MMRGLYSARRVRNIEGDVLIVFMVYFVAIVKGTPWRF